MSGCSDEECVTVLKKCREAIPKIGGGKVIIIDIVMDGKTDEHELLEAKLSFDLLTMACQTGKWRSQKDWEKIFLEAGFTRCKVTPIFGLKHFLHMYQMLTSISGQLNLLED